MSAAAFLREVREAHVLTQRQLAQRSHTSQSVISRFERGRCSPTVRELERLLHCMGTELVLEARDRLSKGPYR